MIIKALRTILPLLFFAVLSGQALAAQADYAFDGNRFIFTVTFEKGYSNFQEFNDGTGIILSFDTTETISKKQEKPESPPVAFSQLEFFDSGIKLVRLETDGLRNRFYFTFEDTIITPSVERHSNAVRAEFTFPAVQEPAQTTPSPVPGMGAYLRMLFGVGLILVIILVAYAVMKYLFKNSTVSDIPGIGRLLGKADIEMKKSLVFYELGEIIYILGVTDGSISVVDKITDPVDVNMIKAGFSRRKDFSSYMKFFRKKNEIKNDMEDSKDILQEKLSSLRKK